MDGPDWKLRPTTWEGFACEGTTSAGTLQLFFTKKLGCSDMLRINPYPLLNKNGC